MTTTPLHASPMQVDETGLQEGTILHTYRDATGTPTIGTGHTAAAGLPIPVMGLTITRAQAETILANDLARIYERGVLKLVKVDLTQCQFDALVDFAFNAGCGNLGGSTLLRKLNSGDYAGAADEFLTWTKSKGVVLSGLVKRRAVERNTFLNGIYPGVTLAEEDTGTAMKDEHTIAAGATGDDVKTLQMQLAEVGYAVKPDGSFGPATDNAVREFQSSCGLPIDGVVGLKTWMALDKACDAKVAPVAVVVLPKPSVPAIPVLAVHEPAATAPGLMSKLSAWWKERG